VKITAALVRDAADAPQFVIGMVEDITRRQEADEALEQERRMLRQMLALQEHDRRLIGYEIHDGLAQYLSGALMVLQSYQHLQSRNAPEALETLETGIGLARQAMQEARRLVGGLRPLVLDEMGIVAGIEYLIEQVESRGGPKVEFLRPDAFQRPSPLVENALFRIAQEGLANAMHHSKSDRVQIALSAPAGRIRLEIRDWGIGFDPQQVPEGHFGVEGIRERTRLLGGDAQIHSRPGQGTTVLVEVPAAEGA
jgi:two-component system sensor histidine kinase DegS